MTAPIAATALPAIPKIITSDVVKPNVPAARIPPNVKMPVSPSRNTALASRKYRVCGALFCSRTMVRHSSRYEANSPPWRAGESRVKPRSKNFSSRTGSTSGRNRSRRRIRTSSGRQNTRHQNAENRATARILNASSVLSRSPFGSSTNPHSTTPSASTPPRYPADQPRPEILPILFGVETRGSTAL